MLGIFLDTETNGLDPYRHVIIEVAFKIVDMQTGAILQSYQSLVRQEKELWEKSDPESLGVNGFSFEELQNGKPSEDVEKEIKELFFKHKIKRGSSVFICQNPSFDRVFFSQLINTNAQESLLWPYHWLDLASMYWAISLTKGKADPKCLPWHTGINKDAIAKICGLAPETKPHRAANGVDHLLACYTALLGFPG